MRDYYNQAKKKLDNGSASGNLKVKMEKFSFLEEINMVNQTTTSNYQTSDSQFTDTELYETQEIKFESQVFDDSTTFRDDASLSSIASTSESNPLSRKRKNCSNNFTTEALPKESHHHKKLINHQQLIDNVNTQPQHDSVLLFLQSLAPQMRELPARKLAAAKIKFIQVIDELEIEVENEQRYQLLQQQQIIDET